MQLNKEYWNDRYLGQDTPWNAEAITTPLKTYFDQLENKKTHILIPGAGNGHEAAYLHQKGFTNVWVCDWAQEALTLFQKENPSFPSQHLICGDFFDLKEITFDLIVEQTFFCALPPAKRPAYSKQTAQLLSTGGKLIGLLFAVQFEKPGPPFGGSKEEYLQHFSPNFQINILEHCYNSIKPRAGKEYFILFQKK